MPRWPVALLCGWIAACSSGSAVTAPAEKGEQVAIVVFAAASLSEAFSAASDRIPQVRPTFSFAGSQQLVTQLTQGATADVVATADKASMQRLVAARLVDAPTTIAHTTLVIAVATGNPRGVTGLAALARPDLTVVLADPSVPAGRYARQLLDKAGVAVRPRSLELDAKATLAKVTGGDADAALVYATDVRGSGGRATAVTFVEASDAAATVSYPIAVVSATRHRPAAEAFIAAAVDGPVHDALLAAGFTP